MYRGRNKKSFLSGSQDQLNWYSDGPANVEIVIPH